jgi:hypothetical protein
MEEEEAERDNASAFLCSSERARKRKKEVLIFRKLA